MRIVDFKTSIVALSVMAVTAFSTIASERQALADDSDLVVSSDSGSGSPDNAVNQDGNSNSGDDVAVASDSNGDECGATVEQSRC